MLVQRNWRQNQLQQSGPEKHFNDSIQSSRERLSFNHLHKILFNKRIPKAFIFNAAPLSFRPYPRFPRTLFPGLSTRLDSPAIAATIRLNMCVSEFEACMHMAWNFIMSASIFLQIKCQSKANWKARMAEGRAKILAYLGAQSKFVCRNKLTLNMAHRVLSKRSWAEEIMQMCSAHSNNNGCLR